MIQESFKNKLSPVIVQVPDDVSGQRRPKKWVQLGQNCYQPADEEKKGIKIKCVNTIQNTFLKAQLLSFLLCYKR